MVIFAVHAALTAGEALKLLGVLESSRRTVGTAVSTKISLWFYLKTLSCGDEIGRVTSQTSLWIHTPGTRLVAYWAIAMSMIKLHYWLLKVEVGAGLHTPSILEHLLVCACSTVIWSSPTCPARQATSGTHWFTQIKVGTLRTLLLASRRIVGLIG